MKKQAYPYNLMNEWGDYTRPSAEPVLSARGLGLLCLAVVVVALFVIAI